MVEGRESKNNSLFRNNFKHNFFNICHKNLTSSSKELVVFIVYVHMIDLRILIGQNFIQCH